VLLAGVECARRPQYVCEFRFATRDVLRSLLEVSPGKLGGVFDRLLACARGQDQDAHDRPNTAEL
jgi:hypothetical protein